jgi:hypothetical protein
MAYICVKERGNREKKRAIRKDTSIGSVTRGKDLLVGGRVLGQIVFL